MRDHHQGIVGTQDGGDQIIFIVMRQQQVGLLRVVGDAVVPVDLLTQELCHRRMEPERLGEPDHGRVLRPQRVEQALVDLVLAEGAPGFTVPIMLHDGRHLPVVADDDQRGVFLHRQRRHDRFRQVHLAGFVQHQQIAEFVAEDAFRPLLLQHPVGAARRDRHHGPRFLLKDVGVVVFILPLLGVLDQMDHANWRRIVGSHPVERHVQNAGVEMLGEQLFVGVTQPPQFLLDF